MAGRVVPLTTSEQTLGAAAEAFLAQPSLARSTRRCYDQTLTRLVRELGSDRPLSTLTVEAIMVAVTTAWGGRAPATWNRQVATVRSFLRFCRRRRWLVEDLTVDLERRPESADRTKAIPLPELEQLWRREDVGVREKALWRLLYETAARASEALAINVEDLDLATWLDGPPFADQVSPGDLAFRCGPLVTAVVRWFMPQICPKPTAGARSRFMAGHRGCAHEERPDGRPPYGCCNLVVLRRRPARRSAEFLGEPDEKAFGPADVAEPIGVFVLDHFAADELRAVLSEPGERLVDVVHSEHDAQVAEGVHRGVPVIGDHTRREKARELEPAVAVRRAHHGDLDALVAQSSDAPCPLSFHHGSPFELEAELAKELDRRVEVLDDDADVVHPFECHVPNLQWVVNPANGSRGPRCHAPKPREPACRLAYDASVKRAEGQIRARCRTTACIGGTFAVRKPVEEALDPAQ